MSIKRIFPLDPYDDGHLKIVEEIINNGDFEKYFCSELLNIRKRFSKEEYLTRNRKLNDIEKILCIEADSKLVDYCYMRGEKDLKICQITFPERGINHRGSIPLITTYIQTELDFEEIFIKIKTDDKTNSKRLTEMGFELIGEENGNIIFLKEKEQELNKQRKI